MNFEGLLEQYSLLDFPVGLGGCQNQNPLKCCEYNITVFDDKKENDLIIDCENTIVKIHHGSLNETNSNVLVQFSDMQIIHDEKWELRMMLAKIQEKKQNLFRDSMKNCLLDSLFCITKAKDGLKNNDPFASCWLKCAVFYLADTICLHNQVRPSPLHLLENLRNIEKNPINEKLSSINDCIGTERATPSLLERMCKSTIGFSQMIEENEHSKIIRNKHDHLVKNSLISDCYFYLGYINRNNMIKIKDSISKKPDLIHVLKVAFDIENDPTKTESQCTQLHKTANEILALVN